MRLSTVISPFVIIAITISLSGCGKVNAQRFKNEQLEPRPEASASSREEVLHHESLTSTESLGIEIFNIVKQLYSFYNGNKESELVKYMVNLGYLKVDYGQYYYSDALGEEFVKGGRMRVNKGHDRKFIAEEPKGHSISTCIGAEDGSLVSVDVCFYNEIAATDFLQSLMGEGFSAKKVVDGYGVVYQKSEYCMTCEIGHEKSWDRLSKDYEDDFSRPIFIFRFYSEDFF
ncbi:MAG: hypothetical protein J5523_04110 [Muribaculaceae bacterium]|nr:hypothetical protein [Muribaculaceae bacterium]